MASLNALLGAYDLDPGDTVYVDTGYYSLPANVRIRAQDSVSQFSDNYQCRSQRGLFPGSARRFALLVLSLR